MKKYKYKKSISYNGKRYYIYADTLEEIGKKKTLKLQELKTAHVKDKNILVKDYIPVCIERYKTAQGENTRRDYLRGLNRGVSYYIGDYRLIDITPDILQDVLNHQKGKSKSQINLIYNGLRFIFNHAFIEGKVLKDPSLNLKKPKGTYNPRRALTPIERELLISIAKTDRRYYAFLLMIFCGCRPGEAFNCRGEDISITDKTPTLHIKGTKTKNADRYVPIPKELYRLIKGIKKNDFICVSSSGVPYLDKSNRRKLWLGLWYKMNIEAGTKTYRNKLIEPFLIPKDLTPYCLRHEYCSNLARCNVDIRLAQKLMGHSNIQMTANIYTHIENKNILYEVAQLIE